MKNNKLKKYMYNISDDIIAECAEFGPDTKQGGKTSSYYVDNVKKTGGSRTAAIAVFSVILFCALGILAALIINHNKRSLNGTPLNTAPESINSTPSTVTEDNQIMTTVKLFVPELLRRWNANQFSGNIYAEYRNELSPVLTGLASYLKHVPDELHIYKNNTAKVTIPVTIDSPLPELRTISRGSIIQLDVELTFSITPLDSGEFLFSVHSINCEDQRPYYQIGGTLFYSVNKPDDVTSTVVDYWEVEYKHYLRICENSELYYPSIAKNMTFEEFKNWMLTRISERVRVYNDLELLFADYSGSFVLDQSKNTDAVQETANNILYLTEIHKSGISLTVSYNKDNIITPEVISSTYGYLMLDREGMLAKINGTRGKGTAKQEYIASYRTEINSEGETVYIAEIETDSDTINTNIILDAEGRRKYYYCRTESNDKLTILEITYDDNWIDGHTYAVSNSSDIDLINRTAYYTSYYIETNTYYSNSKSRRSCYYVFYESNHTGTACFFDEEGREIKEAPAKYDFEQEKWQIES